jgi:hypothetical protein
MHRRDQPPAAPRCGERGSGWTMTLRQPGDPGGTHGFASRPCGWFALVEEPGNCTRGHATTRDPHDDSGSARPTQREGERQGMIASVDPPGVCDRVGTPASTAVAAKHGMRIGPCQLVPRKVFPPQPPGESSADGRKKSPLPCMSLRGACPAADTKSRHPPAAQGYPRPTAGGPSPVNHSAGGAHHADSLAVHR